MKKKIMMFFLLLGSILMVKVAMANVYFRIFNYTREGVTVSQITSSSCATTGGFDYFQGPIYGDGSIPGILVGGPYTTYVGTTLNDISKGVIKLEGADGSSCTACYSGGQGDYKMSHVNCTGQFFLGSNKVNSNTFMLQLGKASP